MRALTSIAVEVTTTPPLGYDSAIEECKPLCRDSHLVRMFLLTHFNIPLPSGDS
jgi:hypothetical protein